MKKMLWSIIKFFFYYISVMIIIVFVLTMLFTSRGFLESPIAHDAVHFEDKGCETVVRVITVGGFTEYEYLLVSCSRKPRVSSRVSISYAIGRIDNKSEQAIGFGFSAGSDGDTYLITYCPRLFLHPKRIKPEGISEYNGVLKQSGFHTKVQWREDEEKCDQPMRKKSGS